MKRLFYSLLLAPVCLLGEITVSPVGSGGGGAPTGPAGGVLSGTYPNPNLAYNVKDYGAVGDGTTDDTTAIQNAINAAPDGATVYLNETSSYKITSRLTFSNRTMLTFGSNSTAMNGAPALIWAGAAHGTMMGIYDSYLVRIRGLSFQCANGNSADYFIDTDRVSGFNSNHFFEYIHMSGGSGGNAGNTAWIGISIDKSNGVNNENMQVTNARIFGTGTWPGLVANDGAMTSGSNVLTSANDANFQPSIVGQVIRVGRAGTAGATLKTTCTSRTSATQIVLAANAAATVTGARVHAGDGIGRAIVNGDNPNAKHNVLRNIQVQYCDVGVYNNSGSVEIYNYGGGFSNTGVYTVGTTEPVIVEQMVTEGNLIEIDQASGNGSITIRNCRGANANQITEGFYRLDGRVTFDTSDVESSPPYKGRIIQPYATGNLRLTMTGSYLAKSETSLPISLSASGLDSTYANIVSLGNNLNGSWPINSASLTPDATLTLLNGITTNRHSLSLARSSNRALNAYEDAIAQDTRVYGDDEIEIFGVPRPNTPSIKKIGTHVDAASYSFVITAVDSLGNRSLKSYVSQVTGVNNTLSATNYLHLEWPATPNATSYSIYHNNPGAPQSQGELLASGVTNTYYDVVANPPGTYSNWSSLVPAWNETTGIKHRARTVDVNEVTFSDGAATPSVALANDFLTANTGATSITNFTNGIDGQTIRVRVNDANTTFVNGSTLVTGTGANVLAGNGNIYTFVLRSSKWNRVGSVISTSDILRFQGLLLAGTSGSPTTPGAGQLFLGDNSGQVIAAIYQSGGGQVTLASTGLYLWSNSSTNALGTNDLGFARNAAGIVEVNNGTAGTFRDLKARYFYTSVTNDASVAGTIGQYVSASVVQGSATALTTATPKSVTSISLTAGDWDVTAIGAITGASTGTEFDVAIGTTNNSMTGTVLGDSRCQTPTVSLAGADASLMIPSFRVSISSTTTYYLIVQETFTVGSPGAYGRISARRVR